MDYTPWIRILLRYVAFPLALWVGLPEDVAAEIMDDPDVLFVVTGLVGFIGATVEGWYSWAKNRGDPT